MKTTGPRPRGTVRRLAIPAFAILVAGAAVVGLGALRAARPAAETGSVGLLFAVAEGPLTISVTEAGAIKPREQEIIKSEIEGRSTILFLIPEGTRVRKGDLLVELDVSQLTDTQIDQEIRVKNADAAFIQSRENLEVVRNQARSDVDKAELALRFAREDLAQYRDGEYPNTLKEREARITLAREELQRAEEKLKWSKVLFQEKYLSESELQADELSARKAALDVALAENNLKLLTDFTFRRKMAQVESDIKQAEMALERVRRKASADEVQAEADLRAKESELKRQTDKLVKVKQQIAKARILAPRDGLVVYATSARAEWHRQTEPLAEGQEVREKQELIYLPTASTFKAEVKVHESNLDKIRIGMPVRLTVDALPGREFQGAVSKIAPLPDPMSMFMNPDLKIFATEIHIEGGGDVLRTGMSCQAEIVVERYASARYVPVQAVVRVNGVPTVFVSGGAGVSPRTVEIGMDNNRMVRLVRGIEPGEQVLLAPPLDAATTSGEARERMSPPSAVRVVPAAANGTGGTPPAPSLPGPAPVGPAVPAAAMPAPPGAGGDGATAGAAGMPGGRGRLSPEERQKMRERLEKMTPEEREALRKQRESRRSAASGEPRPEQP